ncbi:hypothetical protein RclHR1_15340002 [Rhizophagus clarus]|uniref:Protein kinase domain-containing protein n=1 Tax=Rhizophagus clarus TaxID=94130 RepID=A0A2Z6QU27_9GLOM|nr:hypothetical protein RclHR1_15340002 [Rhizophagus clarus]
MSSSQTAQDDDDIECKYCGKVYTEIECKWCQPCQMNNLKQDFENWTSGNEKVDELIQKMQMGISTLEDRIIEWISYDQFSDIKEISKNDSATLYSAIWLNGPLEYEYEEKEHKRMPDKNVALKYLYNSKNIISEFLNEVKMYFNDVNEVIMYGITKNPGTNDYIIVLEDVYCENCGVIYVNKYDKWCKPCEINNLKQNFKNWTSGNKNIDELIQEMQLKINRPDDIIVEWISYDQFDEIEEMRKNDSVTLYSAVWMDNPVVLKCLHNSQYIIDEFLNEVKSHFNDINEVYIYGISQHPNTSDYTIVLQDDYCANCSEIYTDKSNKWCKPCQINNLKQKFTEWTSGNKNIDEFIQEMQLKINAWDDGIFEWISYDHFSDIKEISKNDSATLYSAIWINGPLVYNAYDEYERVLDKNVALKCLHNSQNIINEFLEEAKSYSSIDKYENNIFGVSQNPDTRDYIMVLQNNYCESCGEMYTNIYNKWCRSCQINNLKQNFSNWTSENKEINEFIQEMQINIKNSDDLIVEWIPYNQFKVIKEVNKTDSATLYSALWVNGPLEYSDDEGNEFKYKRVHNKEIALKCLHNLQDIVNEFLKEVKTYSIDIFKGKVYGITQNPNTSDYIIVLESDYCKNCGEIYAVNYNKWCKPCEINNLKQNFANWTSGNKKIDELIQEMQLKINENDDIIVKWISYDQFNDIKKIGNNSSATLYSAIWVDGQLKYNHSNYKKVTLKCFYNSQNITSEFLNEVNSYSIKYNDNILVTYGISQNPNTNDYIIVLEDGYCENCGEIYADKSNKWCEPCQINDLEQNFTNRASGNEKIDNFIKEMLMNIKRCEDLIVEWIPYNQFSNIKEIIKSDLAIIYSAIWMDGPLIYDYEKEYKRTPNDKFILKCLLGSQSNIDGFLNEVKSYFTQENENGIIKVFGITQNPDTKDYIIVFSNDFCENCGEIYANIKRRWCKLCHINYLKQNLVKTSENEKIDKFLQEMQLKINNYDDVIVEWIPHDRFNDIKKIGVGGFAVIYSAIWKDGPLEYDIFKMQWKRIPNKEVALKCLNNSQNITDEFLNEVKKYSINNDEHILQIYGISQNPDTKDFIMVLQYARGGDFVHYINNYVINWFWYERLFALESIIKGLRKIHDNDMVHRDFHTGNILSSFDEYYIQTKNPISNICISDMGLCGNVNNVDKSSIVGVMPFVAPEVLKQKPYTRAADIYSFGMIMYFVATKRQPFANLAHDSILALSICNGNRPEINEQEAPKCYIDLMKKCWDSNPDNRPNAFEIEELIKLFISNENEEVKNQFEEAEKYRIANLLSIEDDRSPTHPNACYVSRVLNSYTNDLLVDFTML